MGKTTMAVDLICNHLIKSVKRCFAVCPTWYTQPSLSRLRKIKGAFKARNVFTNVDDQVFEHIYRRLIKHPMPTLLFVDDAAAEAATNKGNKGSFSRLCLASPHLKLTIVGCFQRFSAASPSFRDNTEGVISYVPTKIQDVDILTDEFNPCPAHLESKKIVKQALDYGWRNSRFTFIWRPNFSGEVLYFSGFDKKINFNL